MQIQRLGLYLKFGYNITYMKQTLPPLTLFCVFVCFWGGDWFDIVAGLLVNNYSSVESSVG